MIGHIVERALIHVFSAMGVMVGVFFVLQTAHRRKWAEGWLPSNLGGRLVLSGLIVFGISTLREPFDVYFGGQPIAKAATDFASWLVGLVLGGLATYRLIWLSWEDL